VPFAKGSGVKTNAALRGGRANDQRKQGMLSSGFS
jgi:hypothetical protein